MSAPHDDRVKPMLLAQAAKRDAYDWNYDDVEPVIAELLARTDLSQASVAAALEAASARITKERDDAQKTGLADIYIDGLDDAILLIDRMITPDQRTALQSAIDAAKAEDNLRAHDLIAGARIGLDTGAASFSETVNFAPETITAILNMLDKALAQIGAKP